MRLSPLLAMIGLVLSLASCNSLSKEECVAADWRVIGDTDGAAGYNPQERFADHVKSCTSAKIVPDQTRWYEGYQVGITRYCTPLSGAAHGEAGDGYHNACPPQTEPGFMRGYSVGKRVHELRSRVNSLQSSISYKESDIDRRYNEMKTANEDQRRQIRNQIDDLERDTRRMRREADDVRYELGGAQRDLDFFRQNPNAQLSPPGY